MKNRRNHVRHHVELPSVFHGERANGEGKTVDISTGGCRIRSDAAVFTGEYLSLLIYLPGAQEPMNVDLAAVRWSIGKEFGVEFIRIETKQQERLRDLVGRLQQVSSQADATEPRDSVPVGAPSRLPMDAVRCDAPENGDTDACPRTT